MGIGFGFQLFQIMFLLMFGFALSSVLVTTIRGMKEHNKSNHSPRLTVPVTIVLLNLLRKLKVCSAILS